MISWRVGNEEEKIVVIIVGILLGIFLLVENSKHREKEQIREEFQNQKSSSYWKNINNLEKILVIKMSLNRRLIMMKRILMLQESEPQVFVNGNRDLKSAYSSVKIKTSIE